MSFDFYQNLKIHILSKTTYVIILALLIILMISIPMTYFLINREAFEMLYKMTRNYESLELDELILGALVFIVVTLNVSVFGSLKLLMREKELNHKASHDFLTNLPNRFTFSQSLKRSLAQAKRNLNNIAVLFIDLDDFKLINDTLGHDAGDDLLNAVTTRLSDTIRTSDLLARQGGDEFILLITDSNAKKSSNSDHEMFNDKITFLSQRIIKALQEPFIINNTIVHSNASIGIAVYPDDGKDEETLLKNSDIAMYEAKKEGKGIFEFYSQDRSEKQKGVIYIVNDLHKALENKNEFRLYYQPIINIQNKKMVGVEALIRWEKNGKLLLPDDFLPVAESSGLMQKIGEWVLSEACAQVYKWKLMGLPLFVSINLSARQFDNINLTTDILKNIQLAGASKELIELEITESAMIKDHKNIENILATFGSKGLSISMDNFGTEYSSIPRLKNLPITKIKIDKSFINGIPIDSNDVSIVKSVIELCNNLEVDSLAEGIETVEQLDFLRLHGCLYGQGFYLSHPIPADEIIEFWDKNKSLMEINLVHKDY